jgi:hypothetical protein
VSTREQVAAAARAVAASLPLDLIDAAEDALDETATLWDHATDGSPSPARDEVHHLLEVAKDDLHGVRMVLRQVPDRIESWITGLGGYALADSPPATTTAPPTVAPAERARRLEQVRRAMSPPVHRARALGAWIRPDGTVDHLTSGQATEWFERTQQWAREHGYAPPYGTWWLSVHIEMQFAIRMRVLGLRDETILVDRRPCEPARPGQDSCDTLLGEWLPPGARLTVIDQAGNRYTYPKETATDDA